MPKDVISSFEKFLSLYPQLRDSGEKSERSEALKKYFAHGGIISVSGEASNGWPRLIYPSPLRISQQIDELSRAKGLFSKKKGDWKNEHFHASIYNTVNNVKKLKDALYWKHLIKFAVNPDYRADASKVRLPVHLVPDKRWRPMVCMFVNDLDYRKQLTETFESSIVYKKDKKLAKYADQLQEFRKGLSENKMGSLQKKIEGLESRIKCFQEILKWAKSK